MILRNSLIINVRYMMEQKSDEVRKKMQIQGLCFSFFAHLALSFDKIGCGSEEQKTNLSALFFVLRSPCTIFAGVKTKGCRARASCFGMMTAAEIIPLRPDAVNAAVGIAHATTPAPSLSCAGQGASTSLSLRSQFLHI